MTNIARSDIWQIDYRIIFENIFETLSATLRHGVAIVVNIKIFEQNTRIAFQKAFNSQHHTSILRTCSFHSELLTNIQIVDA